MPRLIKLTCDKIKVTFKTENIANLTPSDKGTIITMKGKFERKVFVKESLDEITRMLEVKE